ALRDVRLQLGELDLRFPHGVVEALELVLDRLGRDFVVRDFEACGGNEMCVAHGNPAGHGIAVQNEVHSPSPNLSAISLVSAAIACSASAPCASTCTEVPWPAASIITPMMLFAFTRRPLRDSQMSLL